MNDVFLGTCLVCKVAVFLKVVYLCPVFSHAVLHTYCIWSAGWIRLFSLFNSHYFSSGLVVWLFFSICLFTPCNHLFLRHFFFTIFFLWPLAEVATHQTRLSVHFAVFFPRTFFIANSSKTFDRLSDCVYLCLLLSWSVSNAFSLFPLCFSPYFLILNNCNCFMLVLTHVCVLTLRFQTYLAILYACGCALCCVSPSLCRSPVL